MSPDHPAHAHRAPHRAATLILPRGCRLAGLAARAATEIRVTATGETVVRFSPAAASVVGIVQIRHESRERRRTPRPVDNRTMTAKRRFAINPAPLQVVPATQRRLFAKPGDLSNAGRCEAELRDGSGRCLNDGKTEVGGRWVCGVHARPPSPNHAA